jgi:hypothetical protein
VSERNPSPGELAHYGVKGMKWGVRKEEETSNRDPAAERYKAAHKPKKTPPLKEGAANLAKNEEKFKAKFEGDDTKDAGKSGKGKVRTFASNHKTALITGAALTSIILAGYISEKRTIESIERYSGKPIPADTFSKHVLHSKVNTWSKDDYFKPQSFEREEFSLPAGHTFHRLSTKAEDSFKPATYATHSKEDFDRYVAQFRQELSPTGGLQHITFRADEEIKVPRLSTVLDTLKGVLSEKEPGAIFQDEHALKAYQELSGGSWSNGRAEGLFSALRKRGYGAIVDEMDAGVIGETPLVVFARELLGPKSSTQMNDNDFHSSENSLIELENRKY